MDRRNFIGTVAPLAGIGPFISPASWVNDVLGSLPDDELHPEATSFTFLQLDGKYVHSRPCFDRMGRHVLFMRAPAGDNPALTLQADSSPWSLWRISRDGGAPEIFFEHSEIRATRPDTCWATGKIAFSGIRGERAELWTIKEDGTGLTHIPVGNPPRERLFYPSWYPDGDRVAVTDYRTHQVLAVSTTTGEVEPVSNPGRVWAGMSAVAQFPSGLDRLAFAGQAPGGAYNPEENNLWILDRGHLASPVDESPGRTPAWSPVGDHLAFSSTRRRPAPMSLMHSRTLPGGRSSIFIASGLSGRSPTILPISPLDQATYHPKWSPDA